MLGACAHSRAVDLPACSNALCIMIWDFISQGKKKTYLSPSLRPPGASAPTSYSLAFLLGSLVDCTAARGLADWTYRLQATQSPSQTEGPSNRRRS